jgi:secreted trypsin-like serine protease
MVKMGIWYQILLLTLVSTSGKASPQHTSEPDHNVTKREITPYIIGGSITPVKTAVALLLKVNNRKDYFCAGTILSENIVITAAHCLRNVGSDIDSIIVVAGESDLLLYITGQSNIASEHGVKSAKKHPNYYNVPGEQIIWDFALLEMTTPITIQGNPNTEAALLPPPAMRHAGREVRVGGWGKTGPYAGGSKLHRAIEIPIKWDRECADIYDEAFYPALMFCAGETGTTTCNGDSGAGAIYNGWKQPVIIGVLSFGKKGCARASVYQKIEKALPWISKESKLR